VLLHNFGLVPNRLSLPVTRPFSPSCARLFHRSRIMHVHAAGHDAKPGTPAADSSRTVFYCRGASRIASPSFLRWFAERTIKEKKRIG